MPIHFADLGLSPVALDLGIFQLRWYAISYVAMIGLGWWYVRKLIARPGAPMSARHADDLVSWIMLGVLIGGRLGYCLVYQPQIWRTPWKVLELWNGGMSLHGGLAGVLLAMWWFARRNNLQLLRLYDYIACCTPFGLFLVRIANFVNGELWGRPSDLPWAMVFPGSGDGIPRHPSQLYEAFLEGGLAMLVLWFLFWKTDARYHPGRLVGTGLTLYGVTRFLLEFTRQPDRGLEHLSWGLTMGQTLCLPMVIAGLWLLIRSRTTPPASDSGRSMSPFEFFMTFYGLLLGLAVAELLGSFANLLRAPVRPRLGLLTPILGAQYLIQIMTTFFDAFVKLQNVAANFAGFALPTVIGMTFFAGAVMVVPRRAEDWSSLDAYFFHQRKWTVGAMVLAFFATVLIELPSVWGFVMAGDWPRFTFYAAMNGVLLASLIIPLFARSRIVIAASLIFNAALLIYLYSPFAFRPFSGG